MQSLVSQIVVQPHVARRVVTKAGKVGFSRREGRREFSSRTNGLDGLFRALFFCNWAFVFSCIPLYINIFRDIRYISCFLTCVHLFVTLSGFVEREDLHRKGPLHRG